MVVRSYPTPDLRDRIYVESRDARLPGYELPEKGSPYQGREAERYEGWLFATAAPSDKVGWTDHYYLNERLNQDAFNFTIEYPWVDKDYPRYTRTYVLLRSDFERPTPHEKDCDNELCVLVDFKVIRLEDQVIDSLFVGVTKTFERVPAPIKVQLDRPESVLPFNQRVAVPADVVTTVLEDATDGLPPAIVEEEDWRIQDETNTAFRRTRETTKRKLPDGGSVLDKAFAWSRVQQIGRVTSSWQIGPQVITPRATLIEASVTDVGNNTTLLEETEVPRVFPNGEFRVEIPDNVPQEFRDLLPVRSTALTGEGQAAPRDLGPGELQRISEQTTELIARETVVGRDLDQLPKTLIDQRLNGIQGRGGEHGGVFDIVRTLDRAPQAVEEGFGIIASSVKNLGSGLTARETERLSTLQGASLLLTAPGRDFTCDPAVVFTSGTVGSGATGTAILSTTPGTGGVDEDAGGTFPLTFDDTGDANGLFYFLGARYNGGVWRNPVTAGTASITAVSNRPVTPEQLAQLVDREPSNVPIFMRPGGGHAYQFNLGPGRTMKVNLATFRVPTVASGQAGRRIRLEGSNDAATWTNLTGDVTVPVVPLSSWFTAPVSNTTHWRYFRIFRTDTNETDQPISLGEVELYGEVIIAPAVTLHYVFDGDARGVFYYLGRRGNNGVWRNPQTNGDVVLTADALTGGTLDEIVDRLPSNVFSDGVVNRGYNIDLKSGRSLVCNKLSFRQRSNFGSGTTSFVFQARNDPGDPWLSLTTITVPQTPDTWRTVDVSSNLLAYRYFRLVSPQTSFTIGELELYGELRLAVPGIAPTTFSVTSIVVNSGGTNYLTAPEIRISGGGGSGAAAIAQVSNGVVIAVTITNPGANYTSVPIVRFFVAGGGQGAVATTALTGDVVTSALVTSGGSEYGAAPLVELIGDGTGATAHAVVDDSGQVTSVVIDTGGSGYTAPPSVLFRNAGGPIGEAIVGYGIADIDVDAPGTNYTSPPAVTVDGDGFGVLAQAILGFAIASVAINNRGQNYTSTPTVGFSGTGTGATGTATRGFPVASVTYLPNGTFFLTPPTITVSGGGIYGSGAQFVGVIGRPLLGIVVGSPGSGYTSDPAVGVTGDGAGASGTAFRSFAVASIAVGAGGAGYTFPPPVTIGPPTGANGVQATAHAVIGAGAVTSIVIDNPGFGYLTTPTIVVGGDGAGATGTATLESAGAIDHISLDAAGTNYTTPATITLTGGVGSGATATSSLNTAISGLLLRVDVVDPGSGYTSQPLLTIPGGVNTFATLSTLGQIVAVTVTNGGSGYTINATVTFSGGGGTGASASGIIATTGKVKDVVITDQGEGFTAIPIITLVGGGGTGALASADLMSGGSIKTLTLIDPGPDYSVAPLVSFFGCDGVEATALYLLGTGWPILTDIITDPVEGIVVRVTKKIVPAGSELPIDAGYVDIYALDKWRSIQLTSKVDLDTLPQPEIFGQTHSLSLPPLLLSVGAAYSRSTSKAIRINEGFGSASVHSVVKGKIVVSIQDGYRGPAKASVTRRFMFGPPPDALTPTPLVITPSSGTAYLTTSQRVKNNSGGTTGGFSYVELAEDISQAIDTLDISGVLTGGMGFSSSSGSLIVTAEDLMSQGITLAHARGINDSTNIAIAVANSSASAQATVSLVLPVSCPRSLTPGTTYLVSVGVEKWRFGIYVQTLTYVTIPRTCQEGSGGYGS